MTSKASFTLICVLLIPYYMKRFATIVLLYLVNDMSTETVNNIVWIDISAVTQVTSTQVNLTDGQENLLTQRRFAILTLWSLLPLNKGKKDRDFTLEDFQVPQIHRKTKMNKKSSLAIRSI
jgi:hypothetical protein